MKTKAPIRLAVFASGGGSNFRNIYQYFHISGLASEQAEIVLCVSHNKNALVCQFANEKGIPVLLVDRMIFYNEASILPQLKEYGIDYLILAGFMWLIPDSLLSAYQDRILNIHPALLPKFGGKGMYGMKVHEAVWNEKPDRTGITIHRVNENYDEGAILFQASIQLNGRESVEEIAQNVLRLEHQYYPLIIDDCLAQWSKLRSI